MAQIVPTPRCCLPLHLVIAALLCGATGALSAQADICLPSADSHEAHAFAISSVPFAFAAASAPAAAASSFGLEVASLPTVDPTNATPTACRPGKGSENTHPIPVIVRPRLSLRWRSVVAEVSWIPPLRVDQVKANLVSVALAHVHPVGNAWVASIRAEAVFGSLRAPVTCDDSALRDPTSVCFGGTRSDDRWQPGIFGVEAAIGWRGRRLQPYAGFGYSLLRPRFEVNFTNASDSTDHRQVAVDLHRLAAFAGITLPLGRLSLSAEAYATPSDAVSARLVIRAPLSNR